LIKARRILTALLICASLTAAGCGTRGEAKSYDPGEVAGAIMAEVTFRDSLVEAVGDSAASFYRLDDTVDSYAIYISGSGATAEEVAVLKVKEGEAASSAKAILEKRVADQVERYESYRPEEMTKLKDPVIITEGDVAVLVLADDRSQAEDAAKAALE
jgi:hypothetical protein